MLRSSLRYSLPPNPNPLVLMRRPFIAGNWKMHLDRAGAVALAKAIVDGSGGLDAIELAVCPPSVYLDAVSGIVRGSPVALGAQNMCHQASGAFTGEICATMLTDLGCKFVILGHSERRHIFGETSADVNKKTIAALAG